MRADSGYEGNRQTVVLLMMLRRLLVRYFQVLLVSPGPIGLPTRLTPEVDIESLDSSGLSHIVPSGASPLP